MKMSTAAEYMQATLIGKDTDFSGVSIDSRKIKNNNLFVALKGPNHDAHNYIEQAESNGAVGFVVEKKSLVSKPQIIVRDTHMALGDLASVWRQSLRQTHFVGITGSNGKTTVKEMLSAILSKCGETIATKGNLNNDIGMPLTLLGIGKEYQYAVIEMGASGPNEIDYLANIAKPHVALVNNAGPAHLEGFGSLEGVAKAKGEIYQHITKDGTAIINFDDKYAEYWLEINANNKVLTFSLGNNAADVVGEYINGKLSIAYLNNSVELTLSLLGEHNARNALAAAAASLASNIDLAKIKQGLESIQAVAGRLNSVNVADDNIIIDDTYNANPSSFKAAIDVLAQYKKSTCLIMGDMGELGAYAEEQHSEIGLYAKKCGIDKLYCCGPLSKHAADSYGQNGLHFIEKSLLIDHLQSNTYKDMVFLVKGSRSAAMEEVVEYLKKHFDKAKV